MKFSIIHPSRSRPDKSYATIKNWMLNKSKCGIDVEFIISLDTTDPLLSEYERLFDNRDYSYLRYYVHDNKSSVEAINIVVSACLGDVLIVVSDDTEPTKCWDCELEKEIQGKYDFILKTQDGIQPWIITMPIMDRTYYNRFGYIYHPSYSHLFCDTELTCVADITGRKITSNLLFPHNHYSIGKSQIDDVYRKNDATNTEGENIFIERYKRNFDLPKGGKIQGQAMIDWLIKRNVAV